MSLLKKLFSEKKIAVPEAADAVRLAEELENLLGGASVYPASLTAADGVLFFLFRGRWEKGLGLFAASFADKPLFSKVPTSAERAATTAGCSGVLREVSCSHEAAFWLRDVLPFVKPKVLGTAPAVGFGDRLGLATPGHARAVRSFGKGRLTPVFSQQSARELARTERNPEDVAAAAIWGVLESGWRDGYGADADHLKTPGDIDRFRRAGFTFFTVDPGEYVAATADLSDAALEQAYAALPWRDLECSAADCRRRFTENGVALNEGPLILNERALLSAAVKYGKAVAHTLKMWRHLRSASAGVPFEVEMSVDETDAPTSVEEHAYIAAELQRLGVEIVSLAPRFVGRFEKGVDYLGDLSEFQRTFRLHASIAKHFGGYKIGIHSGSDKFSVYPIAARLAGGAVHVKTAGTSYLEALRVAASCDVALFREILTFAHERYETDKATYHVSADLAKVPKPHALSDDQLPKLLDQFDARQVLHVTFGSVLTTKDSGGRPLFKSRLLDLLKNNEEKHYACLESHLGRHVAPLVG